MKYLKKISGYRTYVAGVLMILHGLYMLFLVPAQQTGAFDAGQDLTRVMIANFQILLGLAVVFIRMGQKNSERKIIDAIRGDREE